MAQIIGAGMINLSGVMPFVIFAGLMGAAKRLSAVRWGITIRIVWAWILPIPGAALIAGTFYFLFHLVSKNLV